MKRLYTAKTMSTAPLPIVEKAYEQLGKLRKSVLKSRPNLDPLFCINCYKSTIPDPARIPEPVSICCQYPMVEKEEALALIEVSSQELGGILQVSKQNKRQRRASDSSIPRDDGEATVVRIDGKDHSLPTRKKARKFLRDHGYSITNFAPNAEGVWIERS